MTTTDSGLRALRKAHGRFYTPAPLALRLARLAIEPFGSTPLRVIDPACGDGAFLRAARSLRPGDALLGVDRDPEACLVCRAASFEARQADALLSPLPSGFDVLLANPPYLSTKRAPFGARERRALAARFRTAKGQFDACGLFVERALELLRPGGRYALLLPRAVLANQEHAGARRILFEEGPPERVIDFGLAFPGAAVEVVGLVGQKRPGGTRSSLTIALEDAQGRSRGNLSIADWAELPELRLPLETNVASLRLRRLLATDAATLGQVATQLRRGIELGRKAGILAAAPTPRARPVLRGRDVSAFHCGPPMCFADPAAIPAAKLKAPSLYDVPEKLVVRRVADRLIAAVDDSRALTLNTIYCVQAKVSAHALACLLNSTLATFWWRQSFGGDDRVFPYVRTTHLAALPLPRGGLETLEALGRGAASGETTQVEVDDAVESLYGLRSADRALLSRGRAAFSASALRATTVRA